jgi:hypothetical protein
MKVNSEGLLTGTDTPMPFEVTDVIVYPNPGNDSFKICSGYKQIRVLLNDLDGECVLDKIISGTSSISTDDLKTGIYLYQLFDGYKEIKSGKWIKK